MRVDAINQAQVSIATTWTLIPAPQLSCKVLCVSHSGATSCVCTCVWVYVYVFHITCAWRCVCNCSAATSGWWSGSCSPQWEAYCLPPPFCPPPHPPPALPSLAPRPPVWTRSSADFQRATDWRPGPDPGGSAACGSLCAAAASPAAWWTGSAAETGPWRSRTTPCPVRSAPLYAGPNEQSKDKMS